MTKATIKFTAEKVERLHRAYDAAVLAELTQFKFEGHDLLTSYARYLLEYLDDTFKRK